MQQTIGGSISSMSSAGPTVRSLTEVFILMRNNAIQSKHVFSDSLHHGNGSYSPPFSKSEDKMSLVPLEDGREGSPGVKQSVYLSRVPPEWVNMVDEVQYEVTRIRSKLKELKTLQNQHLLRPNFDDDEDEKCSTDQGAIRASSEQLSSMLSHSQRLVQHIQKEASCTASSSRSQELLIHNVVMALVSTLQGLMSEFRSGQSEYVKRLRSREDNYQQFFDQSVFGDGADSKSSDGGGLDAVTFRNRPNAGGSTWVNVDEEQQLSGEAPQPMTMAQLTAIEDSSTMVAQREKDILEITKSIVGLNTMFRDLASIVVEQGTIVDRIDYNCEQSAVRVKSALTQVKKAESYQKKNRKMMIILVLAAIITFLIVVKIFFKVIF